MMQNAEMSTPSHNPGHLTHPKYRADIDGLRAIAILSVVGFHAFPLWVKGGFVGVDIFFVISGYLISTIIINNLERNSFSFIEFYIRRIKRIFPALALVLAACFAFGWFVLAADEYKQLGKHIAGGAGFVSNFLLWNESGYFDKAAESKPLLHLWSLGIEEQFYIVWPLLLWVAWKKRLNLLTLIFVVAFISFALNVTNVRSDTPAAFYSPQTRFWELLAGSALAYITLRQRPQHHILSRFQFWLDALLGKIIYAQAPEADGKTLRNMLSAIGTALIAVGILVITKSEYFPGWWAVLPTLGAMLIISAGAQAWINQVLLSNRLLVWIGLISFPLYLWHWPLLSFARIVEGGTPSHKASAIIILFSIVLAWLTYWLIEKPVRFGNYSKAKAAALLVLMTIVGYIGYNSYVRNGLVFRFPVEVRGLLTPVDFKFTDYVRFNECHLHTNVATTKHPASCFEPHKPSLAIWGDSHAGALYPGFKKLQTATGLGIIQLTQSGCPPVLNIANTTLRANCSEINTNVISSLAQAQPTVLVLHAHWGLNAVYFGSQEKLESSLKETLRLIKQKMPNTKIVVIGPVPFWKETPQQTIYLSWMNTPDKTKAPKIMQPASLENEMDDFLEKISMASNAKYVSVNRSLCDKNGCVSRTGERATDLIAVDNAHFSKAGAEFFVEKIKQELLSGINI